MTASFPFSITFNKEALLDDEPWQLYQAAVDFNDSVLSEYKILSDKYTREYYRISLVDVAALIIQERAPKLLDHIEFDEEGYLLDIYLASEEAVQLFIALICPVFQQLSLLDDYMRRIADHDKL